MRECWEWKKCRNAEGYGVLRRNKKTLSAHRVAWNAVNGPIPDGMCVLHRCDNPGCVNPEHLFLGTLADNMADMVQKGRGRLPENSGERNGGAKLTWSQVREIRSIRGETRADIAKRYGIAQSTLSRIIQGASWKRGRRVKTNIHQGR